MTWLAPWALGAGALGMLSVVVAHLLSRQRPRALALATARFLPSGMLEATTVQPVPQDRWWMLLRLLIIALLAMAVARPVLTGTKVPTTTVLLLDRTLPADVQRTALATLGATDVVVPYDTIAGLQPVAQATVTTATRSSLSAALGRLVRVRDSLALGADRLRIVVASTFAERGLDPATRALRTLLPDSIAVLPVRVAPDSATSRGGISVRSTGDDPLAATVQLLGDSVARAGTVIERGAAVSAGDSLSATAGATVVHWPATAVKGTPALQALTVAKATWIAPLQRDTTAVTPGVGTPIGWWVDGAPAAWRRTVGSGCIISVRAAMPVAGDHALSLSAQALVRALVTQCDVPSRDTRPAPAWLAAPAARAAFAPAPVLSSRIAPWLLGAAILLAVGELLLRAVRPS